ncbi:ficolin-2-like [Drosophila nasuta]|uniref:ficolin-2-like n=1 Tax=Drosophila nasuta TaxID=42062 RepID=UPI00295F555D|nr:ficolin-2-like [Drosophila nasuta]
MNIIHANIFLLLLMSFEVNSSCTGQQELDSQCSTYCYQVVKPLLQYVNTIRTMTQEQNELHQTITVQAEIIKSLNVQLLQQIKLSESYDNHNRNQQNLIDQYKMQSELTSKSNKSWEIQRETQQKLIDQHKLELTYLNLQIESKDKQIKNLQTENVKTKELQSEQSSSCLGRLTGFHMITLPATKPFIVPCESNLTEAGIGWTVIQRRKDGSVDFNRTWAEYKEGFGDLSGEFFLGLEKLHLLTQSQPHELYILLGDFANETRYARYNNFVIGNEKEFYKLKELGIYFGNAGDALKYHKNEMFSTADKIKHVPGICAKMFESGWWFASCYYCNLNGKYAFSNTDEESDSVEWRKWKRLPMKFAQMMIRPITN